MIKLTAVKINFNLNLKKQRKIEFFSFIEMSSKFFVSYLRLDKMLNVFKVARLDVFLFE